ncbi:MAG: M23 family metallopeptidase [Verrucomicrobiaceae bacterium]|nr:M23 family metallopeptidase [Verrucomicrobiaceae bacterium]
MPASAPHFPLSRRHLSRSLAAAVLMVAGVLWHAPEAAAQAGSSIRVRLADGFDFPVGKPDAAGYHKARGYFPNGHLGEDWNGNGGGDSDLGAPIYSCARGVVIFSANIGVGWGNCIIVRHVFREADGRISMVDSLYAHLHQRVVKLHDLVEKGQLVGTMGGNNGMYFVHLHFEIRKDLRVGMNRSQFPRDNSVYHNPTAFINARRTLAVDSRKYSVPVNNFAAYGGSLADSRSDGGATKAPAIPKVGGGPAGSPPVEVKKPDLNPEDDDFWSRLKAKIRGGSTTSGPEEKK